MSECITKVEKIKSIEPHPNADRLELAKVRGWLCVVPKGVYSVGDLCVYIPIDSVLPQALEEELFSNAKVKLNKGRIKTIRLRGAISQGLIANPETIFEFLGNRGKHIKLVEGLDITEALGIKKYEPALPKFQQFRGMRATKKQVNPHFGKYTDLQNIKNYDELFKPEDDVVVTEKIHGTNFRAGWVPFYADTFWKKIKKLLFLTPKWEFVYGSHNVQLQGKHQQVYYDTNVYYKTVKQYDLQKVIPKGYVIYGEIYGDGIQKGYSYGLRQETKLVVFDIKSFHEKEDSQNGKYISYDNMLAACAGMKLRMAPLMFSGKFKDVDLEKLYEGPSELSDSQLVKEGVVICSVTETQTHMGRKKLKCINPEYLLNKSNTDFH